MAQIPKKIHKKEFGYVCVCVRLCLRYIAWSGIRNLYPEVSQMARSFPTASVNNPWVLRSRPCRGRARSSNTSWSCIHIPCEPRTTCLAPCRWRARILSHGAKPPVSPQSPAASLRMENQFMGRPPNTFKQTCQAQDPPENLFVSMMLFDTVPTGHTHHHLVSGPCMWHIETKKI